MFQVIIYMNNILNAIFNYKKNIKILNIYIYNVMWVKCNSFEKYYYKWK